MKDQDINLKIQAFVDGELAEGDQAEMASLAARDPDVHALIKELKQTRQALSGYDESLELPESREFYWSRIQRQIERLPVEPEKAPRRISWMELLTRWLVPSACLAGLVAAGFIFLGNNQAGAEAVQWQAAYDGVNTFTYRDYDEGMTILWFSYPSDNKVENLEEADTLN